MFEFIHFQDSMASLGAKADQETFQDLLTRYSEPSRFYHDKSHVAECLTQFQKYRRHAENPGEIEVAIWFHDAIYDTTANDNEERSASLAEDHLKRTAIGKDAITRIVEMILATKSHQVTSVDSMLMVDVDLGILGAPAQIFDAYDQNIRKEYHWVPNDRYLSGRVQVLKSFQDREMIYHINEIRDLYEAQARRNLHVHERRSERRRVPSIDHDQSQRRQRERSERRNCDRPAES